MWGHVCDAYCALDMHICGVHLGLLGREGVARSSQSLRAAPQRPLGSCPLPASKRRRPPPTVPAQALVSKCSGVSCGAEFTMWLCEGKLWSAGLPQYGQLGHGTDNCYNAADSSVKVGGQQREAPLAAHNGLSGLLGGGAAVSSWCWHRTLPATAGHMPHVHMPHAHLPSCACLCLVQMVFEPQPQPRMIVSLAEKVRPLYSYWY